MSDTQEELNCERWLPELLESARRAGVTSNYRGLNSQIPFHLRDPNAGGRVDFELWAQMPEVSYSATPESIYKMNVLRKGFNNNPCHVKDVVEQQAAHGVTYPPTFYVGLILAGIAVVYSLR